MMLKPASGMVQSCLTQRVEARFQRRPRRRWGAGASPAQQPAIPALDRFTGRLAVLCLMFGLAVAKAHAGASVVEVVVSDVRDDRGHVRVAICPPQEFLKEQCTHNGRAPARAGIVVVRVTGVPPGTYAVQAWHDEKDRGRIERNFLGIPRQGVGFSNDPSFRFGPPLFQDAAFLVGPNGGRAALTLHYF